MGYYVHVDVSDVENELERLSDVPEHVRDELEAALVGAYQATQELVHVVKGVLKASGRVDSDVQGAVWTGEVSYGGPSTSVDYAEFEQQREGVDFSTGTSHDFLAPATLFDPVFGAIVDSYIDGD